MLGQQSTNENVETGLKIVPLDTLLVVVFFFFLLFDFINQSNFTMENDKISAFQEEDDLACSSRKNDDEMIQERFIAFQRKDVSLLSQIILLIIVSVGSFFFRVVTLVHEQTVLNIFLFAYAIFVIILGWSAFILRRLILEWNSVHHEKVKYLNQIEKLWFLSFNITVLLEIVSISVSGICNFSVCKL